MNKSKDKIKIDIWRDEKFSPKKYRADAYFYPHGSFGYCYRGNIYDGNGRAIGDYGADDSTVIEENFIIKWKD